MSFFQGMINTLYVKKVKNFLKTVQDHHEQVNNSEKPLCAKLSKIYKSYYLWLDESKMLDSTLYIPALSPVHDPEKLALIISGDSTLWLDLVDHDADQCVHREAVISWDKSHFRHSPPLNKKQSFIADSDKTPTERIIKRLQSYDERVPAPVYKRQVNPIPQIPMSTLVCQEALINFLETPLSILNEMSSVFSSNSSAYGSLNCSYLELSPQLWRDEEVETLVKQTCPGTKKGKEKIECLGAATVLLKYSEARKQEAVSVKLETNRRDWESVETKLLAPPSVGFVTAASSLNQVCNKILRLYEKDLGRGEKFGVHHSLALAVFYKVSL